LPKTHAGGEWEWGDVSWSMHFDVPLTEVEFGIPGWDALDIPFTPEDLLKRSLIVVCCICDS